MREQVYAAGPGRTPPELVGRDHWLQRWALTLEGARESGRVPRDAVLTGASGSGRTVLLERMLADARAAGYRVVRADGRPGPWLRDELAGRLAGMAQQLGLLAAEEVAPFSTGFGRLSTFVAEVLADLARTEGLPGRGLVIGIEDLDHLDPDQVARLAEGVTMLETAPGAQVLLVCTGGPETWHRLHGRPGERPVNPDPDQWFELQPLPGLTPAEAALALTAPAGRAGVDWEPEALRTLVTASAGHPGRLQFCAAEAWGRGSGSGPVTVEHVEEALRRVVLPSAYGPLRPPPGPVTC